MEFVRRWVFFPALLTAILLPQVCEAGDRKLLWKIDLPKLIGETIKSEGAEPVWGIAFSPNESRLAVGFGQHRTSKTLRSRGHVIVVSLERPQAVLRQIEVESGQALDRFPANILWSPTGKYLAILGKVYDANGQRTCDVTDDLRFRGFLSGDRTVYRSMLNAGGIQVRLPDCSLESHEHFAEGASEVRAVCPEQDLLVVESKARNEGDPIGAMPYEMTLASYSARKVVRRWRWDYGATLGGVAFADSCKALCSGKDQDVHGNSHAACWKTPSGEQTQENRHIRFLNWEPSGLAFSGGQINGSGGSFVISTTYKWPWYCVLSGMGISCFADPVRRILWNVATGEETLTWAVPKQRMEMWELNPRTVSDSYAVGLSPTGRYVAEGGEGSVQLYVIQ